MDSIHKFYDSMAEISISTHTAIANLKRAKESVQQALHEIQGFKKHSDMPISPVSNITINDVHRDLLFFELLLNQTHGVASTFTFQELLELTNYLVDEESL